MARYGFDGLGLNRLHAVYFKRNPASGRVMQKLGMRYEGCLSEHVKKWGVRIANSMGCSAGITSPQKRTRVPSLMLSLKE